MWNVYRCFFASLIKKKIQSAEKTTSAEVQFCFHVLFVPCVSLSQRQSAAGYFYFPKGVRKNVLEIHLPRLWDTPGL